jgi:hypothetical protein
VSGPLDVPIGAGDTLVEALGGGVAPPGSRAELLLRQLDEIDAAERVAEPSAPAPSPPAGQSEAEEAAEFKRRLREALGPVADVVGEARGRGIVLVFALEVDSLGRTVVASVEASKTL